MAGFFLSMRAGAVTFIITAELQAIAALPPVREPPRVVMMKHIALIGVLLSLFALSAGDSLAQSFGRNKIQHRDYSWHVLSTPHFDIHFYEGEEAFSVRAAMVLEDGYRMLAEKLNAELPWRVPVILYASHNEFLETNVSLSLLPEGVQAFAEPSRRRIVLPFTGSFTAFHHTAVHELAHVFTFSIVYNRLMDSVFTRNYLFAMPGWLAEGLAEYLSVGWDPDSDMFIRDAVIYDYLIDLDYVSGYYTYKEGQSVMNYIADTYGHRKILEILTALGTSRNANYALKRTIGIDIRELNRQWQRSLRKHYWSNFAHKTDVEQIGRRLTDHVKDHGYYNTKPVLSPDGERIVFFTDRDGLIDIYLISALDGQVLRKLVSGHRSNRFESLHFFSSSLCFSPDGTKIAFVAKSKGRDVLYLVRTSDGDVIKTIEINSDGLSAPDWSPLGDSIVLTAIWRGQTDLVLVDVDSGSYKQLTNDVDDQLTPRFFPDGRRIVYTYYPEVTAPAPNSLSGENLKILGEMDFISGHNVRLDATLDIYMMDTESGETAPLVKTSGDDTNPLVLDDGKRIVFTSDESGISNLYIGDIETGAFQRFTDVLGGVFTPDVQEEKGRLTFAAFVNGGYDIFVTDDFDELITMNYGEAPVDIIARNTAGKIELPAPPAGVDSTGVLGPFTMSDTTGGAPDSAPISGRAPEVTNIPSVPAAGIDSTGVLGPFTMSDTTGGAPDSAPVSGEAWDKTPVPSLSADADSSIGRDRGSIRYVADTPFEWRTAGPDSIVEGVNAPVGKTEIESRGATVSPYKVRLSPDFIGQGAGFYFSTGLGFGLSNTIALSDMLGNHRAVFAFNIYRDIQDSDFLLSYYYLKKRIDYGIGLFQFKNFLNSRITSVGESFLDYRLFTEKNYGLFAMMSVPFSTFYRMDLEFQGFVSDREFFEQIYEDPETHNLVFEPTRSSRRRLIEPSISFVHDASFYSYFGPVEGSRWIVSLAKGIAFGGDDVSRTTGYVDYRWYRRLFYRNSIAFRFAFAASEGTDPRSFYLGGPLTLRGYDYLEFEGTRLGLMSVEYRYPLIDALIFGWPARWGFGNIGGTAFFDAGSTWRKDDFTPFKKDAGGLQFEDIKADYGFGMYFNLGFLLLNFQFAWETDLRSTGDSQFHFFLGPTF